MTIDNCMWSILLKQQSYKSTYTEVRIEPLFSLIWVTAYSLQRHPYAFSLNHYAWPQQLIICIIIFIVYAFEENIFFLKLLILLIRLSFFLRFTGIALFWPVGVSRYIFFLQKGIYKAVILKLDIEQPFCFIVQCLANINEESTAWFYY